MFNEEDEEEEEEERNDQPDEPQPEVGPPLLTPLAEDESKSFEPPRGKTNNVVSEQVPHKPTCTSTEKSYKLEISDLSRRGIVLSV